MPKSFNIIGVCIPELHYMVNTQDRIKDIATNYIANGCYFTINRARQFGKTTTLYLLEKYLKEQYVIIRLSFEIADELFNSLYSFSKGLVYIIYNELKNQGIDKNILDKWNQPVSHEFPFNSLSRHITELCKESNKKIILMIDEIDKSSDNQIFLSFLGLLRNKYLEQQQQRDTTFQSVILAGVYDIKNLKLKLRPDSEHQYNSPWNIAADFDIDMSLSVPQIAKMLEEYEADNQTGMDIKEVAEIIYEYTSGYPVLVSSICKQLDEKIIGTEGFETMQKTWTKQGIEKAVSIILKKSSPLFESMVKQLDLYADLYKIVEDIIYCGKKIPFSLEEKSISLGNMFGFLKEENGHVAIANRMFEMCLLNMFMVKEAINSDVYAQGGSDRIGFIKDNMLDMTLVLKKFAVYFTEIYGQNDQKFIEKQGRKIFLIYLKPIINGIGNYYIEAQTRDERRTDIIVDYLGEQFIVELKIWHGSEYNERGEKQLTEYLDYYRKDKGYLLSFNFNKNKETGVKEIQIGNQVIVEAVV